MVGEPRSEIAATPAHPKGWGTQYGWSEMRWDLAEIKMMAEELRRRR